MTAIAVLVDVEAGPWGDAARWQAMIARAVSTAAEMVDLDVPPEAELSVLLTDDAHIRALNRVHRGKDTATNVLSFPGFSPDEPPQPLLGDIVLAHETLTREAAADDKTMDNHFTHLVIHGFLHLFGFDHESVDDAEEMEAEERAVLQALGIADPYADREVVTGS